MRVTRNTAGHQRTRLLSAAFALGLLASFWSADGARAQGAQDAEYACRPDVFRLCDKFIPNSGPITQCLKRNVRNLSPECRTAFAGRGKKASRKVRHRRHRR
jgi:hypothetical protein